MQDLFFLKKILILILTMLIANAAYSSLRSGNKNLTIQDDPVRRALIVAVSEYDTKNTGWSRINADRDAGMLIDVLQRQGFHKENIILLQDRRATRVGIMAAFDTLIGLTGRGDIVYFHFSGHGQQITDDDGDEVDGYDEALIPYDAPRYFRRGVYEGENHLRDDKVGEFLERLRKRTGSEGSVLVTLDACHSGTATRGFGVVRGSSHPFGQNEEAIAGATAARVERKVQYSPGDTDFLLAKSDTNSAPIMVISASAAHENNYEMIMKDGTSMGSLTWIFCKSLEKMTPNSSNHALFHYVRVTFGRIHPYQQPQFEGDADHLLFSGKVYSLPTHFIVTDIINDSTVRVNGGTLHGLNPGTTVGFYPPDTRDPLRARPFTEGTVSSADHVSAVIITNHQISSYLLDLSWCLITGRNFGDVMVSLSINLKDTGTAMDLKNSLKEYQWIVLTDTMPMVVLAETDDNRFIQLFSAEDIPLINDPPAIKTNPGEASVKIAERLWIFAQSVYLRHLEASEPSVKTEISIIAVKDNPDKGIGDDKVTVSMDTINNDIVSFTPDDRFTITIANKGQMPLYFNLLDIQPDNLVNVILPSPGSPGVTIQDLRLEPGASFRSQPFEVNPPYGTEVLKCISTSTPLDLTRAFVPPSRRPPSRAQVSNPLERLFSDNQNINTGFRSGNNLPQGAANIETVTFLIRPQTQ